MTETTTDQAGTEDPLPLPGTGAMLTINSPLSEESVHRLARAATAHHPASILDYGCGWATMLLACLDQAPHARGVGLDVHQPDIVRGSAAAQARGLSDRVELRAAEAATNTDRADLLINLGAFHAFGTIGEALTALRGRRTEGGRLLFGCEYWVTPPTTDELAHMWPEASVADCDSLPEIADAALAAGWQILDLHDSTRAEFDAFDLGHLRERQEWLTRHPEHPEAGQISAEVTDWLRGHRRPMGFATFLLG
ncbi:SAM-dependent methyltransferase [Ruania zhangjianzhongii]|uniref:SAM-dependent methyltransferase n=1 Tax=Ruania zhangjianzhongii TaxID=2603206 RepID=UPI0011CBFE41|nr:methyltransferase [Ruania zhangjianzhongii]